MILTVELVGERGATELVYVYLGSRLPDYALSSVRMSAEASGFPVRILANFPPPKNLPKEFNWTATESFYREDAFKGFEGRSKLPASFREGFWLKTAERFFVLRDYFSQSKATDFFHAELDVLVYSLDNLHHSLQTAGESGIFLPREADDRIVASLMSANSSDALDRLCDSLLERADCGNEMDILGSLTRNSAPWLHNFPTAEYLYRNRENRGLDFPWTIAAGTTGFVVDGAVLGRWLFGVDPRNTNFRGTRNMIQRQKNTVPFEFPLGQLLFRFDRGIQVLSVRHRDGPWFEIVAVHVHSKIHRKLSNAKILKIVQRVNRLKDTVIVRREFAFYRKYFSRIRKDLGLIAVSPSLLKGYALRAGKRLWW
jgi:hypothetical protein